MTDDKFQAIEITLAHQERQINDLNEMINRQWKDIDQLRNLLQKTQDKLAVLEGGSDEQSGLSTAEIAALEKPPHY